MITQLQQTVANDVGERPFPRRRPYHAVGHATEFEGLPTLRIRRIFPRDTVYVNPSPLRYARVCDDELAIMAWAMCRLVIFGRNLTQLRKIWDHPNRVVASLIAFDPRGHYPPREDWERWLWIHKMTWEPILRDSAIKNPQDWRHPYNPTRRNRIQAVHFDYPNF